MGQKYILTASVSVSFPDWTSKWYADSKNYADLLITDPRCVSS